MKPAALTPLVLASNHPPAEAGAPRTDFVLLAQALGDAPLLCPPPNGSDLVAKLADYTASDLRQAILAVRQHSHVGVYVSLSEKIGLPLALLLASRRICVPHVLVAHHLTSPRKRALQSRIRWLQRFTRIVVLSEPQAAYLKDEAGYPAERTDFLRCGVDTAFWRPQGERWSGGEPFILSVGQERRDYATLFAAARELPATQFVVVVGSAWAARKKQLDVFPPNVTLRHDLKYADLRTLYEHASLVVVPLGSGVQYAAGATGVLEGMAMGKPVVVTSTPGLSGYIRQDETARVVAPADPRALADAIWQLQSNPVGAAHRGAEARRAVEARHEMACYVASLARIVREAEAEQ